MTVKTIYTTAINPASDARLFVETVETDASPYSQMNRIDSYDS